MDVPAEIAFNGSAPSLPWLARLTSSAGIVAGSAWRLGSEFVQGLLKDRVTEEGPLKEGVVTIGGAACIQQERCWHAARRPGGPSALLRRHGVTWPGLPDFFFWACVSRRTGAAAEAAGVSLLIQPPGLGPQLDLEGVDRQGEVLNTGLSKRLC